MYLGISFMMFAEWLNKELEKRNLTSAELAQKSGLSTPTIWRIINGTRTAGVDSILGIAKGLGMAPVEVFCYAIGQPLDNEDAKAKRVLYLYGKLPQDDKDRVIAYIEAVLDMLERKG